MLFGVVLITTLSYIVCAIVETTDRYNINESVKTILEKNETAKDLSSSSENHQLEEDVGQVVILL
jgi:hypothetical protein